MTMGSPGWPAEVVIYHGGCWDGFAAAMEVHREVALDTVGFAPAPELIPAHYGMDVPAAVDGRRVWVVDFSFPPEQMLDVAARASHLTWCDHHKSAVDAMAPHMDMLRAAGHDIVVDTDRSGVRLTWSHVHPNATGPAPWPVRYVEDRDLWRKALPHSDQVSMWIRSHDMTEEAWETIRDTDLADAIDNGEAMLTYHRRLVSHAADQAWWATIGQVPMPVTTASYDLGSDVADELIRRTNSPVAAYMLVNRRGEAQYGLRSRGGYDCSAIAKMFGGGGHPQASGFHAPARVDVYTAPLEA